jgi:hypothetical protein
MSRKYKYPKKSTQARSFPLWPVLGAVAVVLVGLGLWLIWGRQPAIPPEVTGAPRLAVDQTVIDEGQVKLAQPVRSTFQLRNVGDQPLHLLGEPVVELVEGC